MSTFVQEANEDSKSVTKASAMKGDSLSRCFSCVRTLER